MSVNDQGKGVIKQYAAYRCCMRSNLQHGAYIHTEMLFKVEPWYDASCFKMVRRGKKEPIPDIIGGRANSHSPILCVLHKTRNINASLLYFGAFSISRLL